MPGFIPWSVVDLSLRAQRSIWLSTSRPDGRPHAVPVWFCWNGLHIFFITRRDTQKAVNLADQPWVVVHVGDGDDVIILEGVAEIVTDREEREQVNALYGEKYVDPNTGASDTIFREGDDLYRVRIMHVMTWMYGKIATRTDWRFDTGRPTHNVRESVGKRGKG